MSEMTRRTQRAGATARFGPRYGVRIRRRALEIEIVLRGRHVCPRCQAPKVKRSDTGVWRCRHCGLVFAGGAYRPIVTTSVRRQLAAPAAEAAAPGGKAEGGSP